MSFYPDPTRGRDTVVGGSSTGAGSAPRTVEYMGRRVDLLVGAGVERELNRLALDGVTTDMLWQTLGAAVRSRAISEVVTLDTVGRLDQAIVAQVTRGTSRRSAVNNIAENPGSYFAYAGRQEYPNAPARQGGRQEFPNAPARQGGRQEFPNAPARQGGRDPFHPQERQEYPDVPARQGANPFDTSRPSGRGQFTTGGGSSTDRK